MFQELQELQSDATRSEKRLRADVDHTIQQLTAEMREEREERLAREAEHTSCTSQLQVRKLAPPCAVGSRCTPGL